MPKISKTPNDQRSDAKNPNNLAYRQDYENRQELGHELPLVPPAPETKGDE